MEINYRPSLKTRMIVITALMAIIQTGFIGFFGIYYLEKSLSEQVGQRALNVAQTLASLPNIQEAIQRGDSNYLQDISTATAAEIKATFIVIGDLNGTRLSHPNPEKIGFSMNDDDEDDNSQVLIEGAGYISKDLGSLGWSMRGKAPVTHQGDIIGIISVGYHLDLINDILNQHRTILLSVILFAFVISYLIAIWFSNYFKKAIFGLEPEQIAYLFDEQKAILESIREGVIAVNPQGQITTINHAAIKTLNLHSIEETVGKSIEDILIDRSILDVITTGKPQYDKEVIYHHEILIANRQPIKKDEQILGVVSSFRKKTELDLISKKLTRIQQYADSLRSQAHEYANKLHTIAGLIQINAPQKALDLIGQENYHHQELISLLLNAVPDPILAGCLIGKYNRARELGLYLAIDKDSSMKDIPEKIPREKLVSILGNLIDNALDATLENSNNKGEVVLSMTDYGNDLIFEVEDQGVGIPDHERQQIFQKGFSSKKEEGHGLGLYIVKQQLGDLNGNISVSEKKPEGTVFTVYIPKSNPKGTA